MSNVRDGVCYGCHIELDPGATPDGCVIDDGLRHWCTMARDIASKWECEWWKPVNTADPVERVWRCFSREMRRNEWTDDADLAQARQSLPAEWVVTEFAASPTNRTAAGEQEDEYDRQYLQHGLRPEDLP